MNTNQFEELLRNKFSEYNCNISWHKVEDGFLVKFHKRCYGRCCSWSNEYFIDSFNEGINPQTEKILCYLEENPVGEIWKIEYDIHENLNE